MKKTFCKNKPFANRSFPVICFIALFSFVNSYAKAGDSISIIPKPLAMQVHNGHFVLIEIENSGLYLSKLMSFRVNSACLYN